MTKKTKNTWKKTLETWKNHGKIMEFCWSTAVGRNPEVWKAPALVSFDDVRVHCLISTFWKSRHRGSNLW